MRIRTADPTEAPALSRLAQRAKASWPYPPEWLQAWESALTISEGYIRRNDVFVVELEGAPAGIAAVEVGAGGPELGHLWVEPTAQGKGIGRRLFEKVVALGEERGWAAIRIESDPYAEAFYERMGAVRVGEVDAPVCGTERALPLMRIVLSEDGTS